MKKWGVILILACTQFIMVLDSTVMNVSISAVVKDLGTTVSGLQAAITFYTLTMAALMLTGGKLGDIWGRLPALRIGSVVYGTGSLLTALSPNLAVLMIGWSLIEGLGAVLVIPAIAALVAINYTGKDRVIGYTLIGAASGIAVAAGPLIGGYVTTYFSWRYVFAAETVVMLGVLFMSRIISAEQARGKSPRLDIPSVLLSASGMALLIFGILQSKSWGWIIPKSMPQIGGVDIAPLGISIVAYLLLAGACILWLFAKRQRMLEANHRQPLLSISLLSVKPLRSGLAVLGSQYLVTAAVFFVLPIYLQMVLGLDALQTGLRIFPLSVAIVVFSALGSRLISRYSPKQIIRLGQACLIGGALFILGSLNPEIKGLLFACGLLVLGAGLGLLASQIGNVTMSSVSEKSSSEVGGMQGTFQNLGASLGTAIIGSVMIMSLTAGFVNSVNAANVTPAVKQAIDDQKQAGIPIASATNIETTALSKGVSPSDAAELRSSYADSQLQSLRLSMFVVAVLGLVSIPLSRNIPRTKLV